MSGDDSAAVDGRANNLAMLAIKGDSELASRMTATARYMKSSAPSEGNSAVLVPGEPERLTYSTEAPLALPVFVWSSLCEALRLAGLTPDGLTVKPARAAQIRKGA